MARSIDGGASFSLVSFATQDLAADAPVAHSIVFGAAGSVLASGYNLGLVTSGDYGASWQQTPVIVNGAALGFTKYGAFAKVTADAKLRVLALHYRDDSMLETSRTVRWQGDYRRIASCIALSRDVSAAGFQPAPLPRPAPSLIKAPVC